MCFNMVCIYRREFLASLNIIYSTSSLLSKSSGLGLWLFKLRHIYQFLIWAVIVIKLIRHHRITIFYIVFVSCRKSPLFLYRIHSIKTLSIICEINSSIASYLSFNSIFIWFTKILSSIIHYYCFNIFLGWGDRFNSNFLILRWIVVSWGWVFWWGLDHEMAFVIIIFKHTIMLDKKYVMVRRSNWLCSV